MKLTFEEPPSDVRYQGRWVVLFDEVRKHPGKWVRVPWDVSTPTIVTELKKGRSGAAAGEFEATSRKNASGRHDLWIRYVGGES